MSSTFGIFVVGGASGQTWRYKKTFPMLYRALMETRLTTQIEMDNSDIERARFPFPIHGIAVGPELERILIAETKIADNALLEALQSYIVGVFANWFPNGKIELAPVLKRLSNSLSATGSVPETNTLKALEELDGWKSAKDSLDAAKAAEILREGTKGFRQARTFLFHQSKCVNGVVGFLKEHEDLKPSDSRKLEIEISSYEALEQWAKETSSIFVKMRGGEKNLKNAKMYAGLWERFIGLIADNEGEHEHPYANFLAGRIREYLDRSSASEFEQALTSKFTSSRLMTPRAMHVLKQSTSKPDFISEEGFPVEIKISSGVVTLIFTISERKEKELDYLLTELTFDFATNKKFSDLGISIQMVKGEPTFLHVSIANMDSVTDLEAVKRYVSKKLSV